jgi:hypothetical protein
LHPGSLSEVALQQLLSRRVATHRSTVDEFSIDGYEYTRFIVGRDPGVLGNDADVHTGTNVFEKAYVVEGPSLQRPASGVDGLDLSRCERDDSRHSLFFVSAASTPAPQPVSGAAQPIGANNKGNERFRVTRFP